MIIITALVCISFSWFYNRTDFSHISNGIVGSIYDHKVSEVEFQRNSRLLRLASQLGMGELVGALTIGAQGEKDAYQNFAWNLLVLKHETDRLGIEPTTEEIANEVRSLAAFKGENGFDLAAYNNFVDHFLGSMGFTQGEIEELAADQIALERVKKILSGGVSLSESQMRHDFNQAYATMEVSVVRFNPDDFVMDIDVNDEAIKKYYDAKKAELKTDEKRQVKMVSFGLDDEQKKLTGKSRIDVLQKLADKANDFTDALQAKGSDFDQAAAKLKLTPKETQEFTKAKPDALLADKPQLVQAAFGLTKEAPNSEAVQTPDGFQILHLMKVEPARPLTAEEARPQIVESLKKEGARQAAASKGTEAAKQLREALKNGKSVADGVGNTRGKVEKIPTFSIAGTPPGGTPASQPEKKNEPRDMNLIKQTASTLPAGSVSDYVGAANGGFVLVLEKRDEPTNADFEKVRATLEENALANKGAIVFYEWLRERRHAAGVIDVPASESPTS